MTSATRCWRRSTPPSAGSSSPCCRIVLIGDVDMRQAMRLLLETTHVVAEEAGAAATAAALKLHAALTGLRVTLPITGGNATAAQLLEALRT
jgi:threonine dehydratase